MTEQHLMYGGGALLVVLLLVVASKGGSAGGRAPFDTARGNHALAAYERAADYSLKAQEIQSKNDQALIKAAVDVQDSRFAFMSDMTKTAAQRDLGMRDLDVKETLGREEIAAARAVSLAQTETQKYGMDQAFKLGWRQLDIADLQRQDNYKLGYQRNENEYSLGYQKNSNELKIANDKNQTERQNGFLRFFGTFLGTILRPF